MTALHPETAKMIDAFARSLKVKLTRAQDKYGYADHWRTFDWEGECQRALAEHVAKGDPLDVAAYAAFCWARGYRTAPVEELTSDGRDDYRGWKIEHNPPPIPTREFDWNATHPGFDGEGNTRQVWGATWDAVCAEIDAWHDEQSDA